MAIELISTGVQGSYTVVNVLGSVKYEAGREYAWQSVHGNTMQYFKTKEEATAFAAEGEAEDAE